MIIVDDRDVERFRCRELIINIFCDQTNCHKIAVRNKYHFLGD
jgi:hypothetical protein